MQLGVRFVAPGGDDGAPRRRRRLLRGPTLIIIFAVVLAALLLLVAPWPGELGEGKALVGRFFYLAAVWARAFCWWRPPQIVHSLQASGPVFIKLAQWLSTRRDLLPEELCDEMGTLHNKVHCKDSPRERRRVEALVPGLHITKLLGGGCVAQVYAGKYQGEDAAIKIRRPGMHRLLKTDIRLLHLAASFYERRHPEYHWLALDDAVETFGWYLRQQVNLSIEAENLRRFRETFESENSTVKGGIVHVPQVKYVQEDVLITSVAQGKSLTEFVQEKDDIPEQVKDAVFHSLTDIMARMVMKHSFIHGDLHPGNIFVDYDRSDNQTNLTLIDAGIAIEVPESFNTFSHESMWAALTRDAPRLGRALVELHRAEGLCNYSRDVAILTRKVGALLLAGSQMVDEEEVELWSEAFDSYEEYRNSRVSEYFVKMIGLLSKHQVRVSPRLWSVMTAFALTEGSVQELGKGVNVLDSVLPYMKWKYVIRGVMKGVEVRRKARKAVRKARKAVSGISSRQM